MSAKETKETTPKGDDLPQSPENVAKNVSEGESETTNDGERKEPKNGNDAGDGVGDGTKKVEGKTEPEGKGARRKIERSVSMDSKPKRMRVDSAKSEKLPPQEVSARRRTKSDNNDDEEEVRAKSTALLTKCIGTADTAGGLAKQVEEAIFDEFGNANDHRYRSRVRSRVSNLTRNKAIGEQLIRGSLSPQKFAKMTPEEMATRELREMRARIEEEGIEEHMLPEKEDVGVDNAKKSDNAVALT